MKIGDKAMCDICTFPCSCETQVVTVRGINKQGYDPYLVELPNGNHYWVSKDSLNPLPNPEENPEFMEAYPEVESDEGDPLFVGS